MTTTAARNDYRVYAESTRHEMLEFVPHEANRILDVGSSVGNFGELLKKERGAEVWGVEPDPEAAAIAETKLDKVVCGFFGEGIDLPKNHFDCIIFNDVLEHMVDPYSALEFSKGLLSPNGKIVASIPNIRYFYNMWVLIVHGAWDYVDAGILDRTHLRFFTRKSMQKMFEEHGFKILSTKGINKLNVYNPGIYRRFKILNLLLLGAIEDMRWLQFVFVVKPLQEK